MKSPDEIKEPEWFIELKSKSPKSWVELLLNPGGAVILSKELQNSLPANSVAAEGMEERRIWELIGLYYRVNQHWYDAIVIYDAMYQHFLNLQRQTKKRVHKGMPLVWIADSYQALGFMTLSKRYLMLTLCEDSINWQGSIDPIQTGSYFRLAWHHGLPDNEFHRYESRMFKLWEENQINALFPEWILQELDQNWQIEIPTSNEAIVYSANTTYLEYLLEGLGEPSGQVLERIADYILSCMPGCRTARRQRSYSTDYDIVCSIDGSDVDFRSEFGRYFVCECKDWKNPMNFSSFAKFCRVLDSVKSRFGIIFSKSGLSGRGHAVDAAREQIKVYQDRGMVIIVVDQKDLNYVSNGGNFISLLRNKYEKVRLDLR